MVKRPRSFEQYCELAKTLRDIGGDPRMIYGLELLTNRRTFKDAKIQKELDAAYDSLFATIKTLVDERLGSSYENDFVKSSYPCGLETEVGHVKQKGPDYDIRRGGGLDGSMGDPFGDISKTKGLRRTKADVVTPDNFTMTKAVSSQVVAVANMGDPFGKAQTVVPTAPTAVLSPSSRVKHRGDSKPGTVKHISASALEDPNVRGVAVEWDDSCVGMYCCSELEC